MRKVNTALDVLNGVVRDADEIVVFHRLETRTKESNIYASIWVTNPDAQ